MTAAVKRRRLVGMKRRDVLEAVAHCQDEFGSLVAGGRIPIRQIISLEKAGLITSVGVVEVQDDDGHCTGRHALGYVLTPAGRALL